MEIVGKFENSLIIKCDGNFYHESWMYGSGCFACEHEKSCTYFDYLNVSGLKEIADVEIIRELLESRYMLHAKIVKQEVESIDEVSDFKFLQIKYSLNKMEEIQKEILKYEV